MKDKILNNIKIVNDCWEWQKSTSSSGYGQITIDKKYWTAHRLSYVLFNGYIPDSLIVRHSCHNKKCCNPKHLLLGSCKDNWNDSKDLHLSKCKERRKQWVIGNTSYKNIKEANKKTGISLSSLVKYTEDGIFDISSYREGCTIANVIPKI